MWFMRRLWVRIAKAEYDAAAAERAALAAEEAARRDALKTHAVDSPERWAEVIELSGWAREVRERNHLTDMFLNLRGGRS